eukprot:TRINITY_DN7119_c0_g1_i1.p1 TRINITY_DN7119_c0_g1~~TRINITY_DN7119_c0_g1_i1.p1  ORF type:complete len:293 (+),score=97.37 TRINITY_DN7119_c0_g1_i1:70-879(+)
MSLMFVPAIPSGIPSPPPSPRHEVVLKPPMPSLNLNITALPAVKVERLRGTVKSFSNSSGFGFIECTEVQRKYSRDVFLHKAQAGDAVTVGTKVEFSIDINAKGMPQARDVKLVSEIASMKFKKPLPPPRSRMQEEDIPDLDSSCASTPLTSPRDDKDKDSDTSTIVSVTQTVDAQASFQQQQLALMQQMQQQMAMKNNMMGMNLMGMGLMGQGMMNNQGMQMMSGMGMGMGQVGMAGMGMNGNMQQVVYQPIVCPVIYQVPVMMGKEE